MNIISTKRLNAGYYEYTFENGLVFLIVKVDGLPYWYYVNANNPDENTGDWLHSKRDALDALKDYVEHRVWNADLKCFTYQVPIR